MAKKKGARRIIAMECIESGHRSYTTTKNFQNTEDRLELRKFNPMLRRHTIYRESKKKLH
ncbi:MAG: 50S ribosomal protein L33 [Candidatus Saccharimonadales bacterium]